MSILLAYLLDDVQVQLTDPEPPSLSKKAATKSLIQQKLAELKRRAQEEADKNASERKKADRLSISVNRKITTSSQSPPNQ